MIIEIRLVDGGEWYEAYIGSQMVYDCEHLDDMLEHVAPMAREHDARVTIDLSGHPAYANPAA